MPTEHNPLLADPTRRCDATAEVEDRRQLCTGWFGDGWRWHGCHLEPEHAGAHVCPCGHQFKRARQLISRLRRRQEIAAS